MQSLIETLLQKHSLLSDQVDKQEMSLICRELEKLTEVSGDVVEFGCYTGTTSIFLQRIINMQDIPRVLHVYDSFEGLPSKRGEDASPVGTQFEPGALAVSKKQFLENFKKAGLHPPRVHKGWFEQLAVADIPERIAFAFLDGDYYGSIKASLQLIAPRLAPGAVIVIDDYANEALPGAAKAVDEWLLTHPSELKISHSLAIITPRQH